LNATSTTSEPTRPVERLLLSIERAPLSAIYRIAIGFALIPLFQRLAGTGKPPWSFLLFFLCLLVLLRLVPLVLRKVLPFSKELQDAWFSQRALSKQYDSFQWRKLFWIGLGLGAYMAIYRQHTLTYGLIAAVCIAGGAAGLWIAHSLTARMQPRAA
jgi:hypothetical protein